MSDAGPGRRYGGRDPQERRDVRRRRLLDAGLELFATQGYNHTTVTDLCRTAGVATAHFYELFDGRETLLRAVYDEVVDAARAAVLEAIVAAPPDAAERSRSGLAAFCRVLLSDPRRARIQCIEVVGVSPALEKHRRSVIHSYVALLVAQLDEIRASRGVPVPDGGTAASSAGPAAEILATALVGGVNEAMIDWLLATSPPPVEVLHSTLGDLFEAVAAAML